MESIQLPAPRCFQQSGANHIPKTPGDIPVSNLKSSCNAKLGRTKLSSCRCVVLETKNATARGPNPSKDPPSIRMMGDCASAVGFTQKTTWETVHSAIDIVLQRCMAICHSTK